MSDDILKDTFIKVRISAEYKEYFQKLAEMRSSTISHIIRDFIRMVVDAPNTLDYFVPTDDVPTNSNITTIDDKTISDADLTNYAKLEEFGVI